MTLAWLAIGVLGAGCAVAAERPIVRFDVAAVVPASPVTGPAPADSAELPLVDMPDIGDDIRLAIPLQLSTLIADPTSPRIQQMLIEVDLQDPNLVIDDYSPRTQLSSPYAGEISIEQTDEANSHLGLSLNGSYPPLLHGDLGGDVGQKQIESRKFQRLAPLEILAASGTTHRGRGVFFKLRATSTQVLEGDKALEIVVRAPANWRGGLIRVHATAQTVRRSLPGMPMEAVAIGQQQFLVAAYREGDSGARRLAMQLINAERRLRNSADEHARAIRHRSAPTVFHQVAAKLDLTEPRISADWLQRVVFRNVDPHHDMEMRRLPVDVRVAVLDYQDARRDFLASVAAPAGGELVASGR